MISQEFDKPTRTVALLKAWLTATETQANCNTCADHMDSLAEIILAHASPIGALAAIEEHIRHCHCCQTEFQALISILKMEQADTGETITAE
ncbi:MAG: hypothetical protein OHK0023_27560 [Anaerolineae bacterium]